MEYDVFISCKSEDYIYAEEIYDFLTKNDINTFLASRELRKLGDSEYRRAISQALKSAYHMIVFASKAEYIDSPWVFYEWDLFINAKLTGVKDGQLVTILKDVKVKEINLDLCKYESFTFEGYKDKILSYVETPSYLLRKKLAQKATEEKLLKEKQEAEVAEIEKMLAKIESDESSVSSDRQLALKKIEAISDEAQRQRLTATYDSTGAIHKAHKLECNELQNKIEEHQSKLRQSERNLANEKRKSSECSSLQKKVNELNKKLKNWRTARIVSYSFIAIIIAGFFLLSYNYNKTKTDLNSINEQLTHVVNEGVPFIITDITIGNMLYDGNWVTMPGETIKGENTYYLTPQIECTAIAEGDYVFKYKLYSNGVLCENVEKNKGYTSYEKTIKLQNGTNKFLLPNWGSKTKGHWKAGNYKIELWYNGLCLKTKEFIIE